MQIRFIIKKTILSWPQILSEIFINLYLLLRGRKLRVYYFDEYWCHFEKNHEIKYYLKSPILRLSLEEITYESKDIYFFKYTPRSGDVCVDIGAGFGYEAMLMSLYVGNSGKVYCIEPAKSTYKALERNVKSNKRYNISYYNLCIYHLSGKVKMVDNEDDYLTNKISDHGDDVSALTMDDFIIIHGIKKIDYLKVNIEGAEKYLIKAFESIKIVKNIAISCHDFMHTRTGDEFYLTKSLVIDFLIKNNFFVFYRSSKIDYLNDWIYAKNNKFY